MRQSYFITDVVVSPTTGLNAAIMILHMALPCAKLFQADGLYCHAFERIDRILINFIDFCLPKSNFTDIKMFQVLFYPVKLKWF